MYPVQDVRTMFSAVRTKIPGVVLIETPVYPDARGYFLEVWKESAYTQHGVPSHFVQDNLSFSTYGVVRGLHYQNPAPQGKLVCPLRGSIYDVIVDIRVGSPTFGHAEGFTLDAEAGQQLYVPEGLAHGFAVLSDQALVLYKCTQLYNRQVEGSVLWNDPDLRVNWPVANPILSDKDQAAPRLTAISPDTLPRWIGN